ncbi:MULTISPECIES: hypothetical protein [Bacillaceae]|uniref:Uncharacterized protein n=1 Tax=Peribacillus huizhouensis TaxID=1501239 RepID=A0ABR6CNZ9_9BACI|nr:MULTISPECIES: hypothetical protein [Bacillaceae]MBA9026774.1 hypothetical protein [Peribacillus huizhouensis]
MMGMEAKKGLRIMFIVICFLLTFLLVRLAFMQLILDKEHYDRLRFSEIESTSSFDK